MDFTFKTYSKLLNAMLVRGFSFCTLNNYVSHQQESSAIKTAILRHDVEEKYWHALRFARIQHEMGIQGSYYFRILPNPYNERVIREIAELGHEVGYHYDDLSECKGDYEKAIRRFLDNLEFLRGIAPVTTITMEGAPLSKYDNRHLWSRDKAEVNPSQSHYSQFGIIAEPYLDLDFSQILYLTDTGRRWDGWQVSLRDKIPQQEKWIKQGLVFRSTNDIIRAVNEERMPNKIMMTFHPQRWNNKPLLWLEEYFWQNIKNQGKRMLVLIRNSYNPPIKNDIHRKNGSEGLQ